MVFIGVMRGGGASEIMRVGLFVACLGSEYSMPYNLIRKYLVLSSYNSIVHTCDKHVLINWRDDILFIEMLAT